MLTLLITILLCQEPELPSLVMTPKHKGMMPIILVIGDDRRSQMLKAELTRDWLSKEPESPVFIQLARLQWEVNQRKITIVDRESEFKYRYLRSYPTMIYGSNYLYEFDDRCFQSTSYPLRGLDAMLKNIEMSFSEYNYTVKQAYWSNSYHYHLRMLDWAQKNHMKLYLELISEDTCDTISPLGEEPIPDNICDCESVIPPLEDLLAKFTCYPDLPERPLLDLPVKPYEKFPWE